MLTWTISPRSSRASQMACTSPSASFSPPPRAGEDAGKDLLAQPFADLAGVVLAAGRQGDVGNSRVLAAETPFRLAVADEVDARQGCAHGACAPWIITRRAREELYPCWRCGLECERGMAARC